MYYASLLSGGRVLCDNLHAGMADKDLYQVNPRFVSLYITGLDLVEGQ